MIELISNLPDHVLALKATGQVTSDDYLQVVAPATETRRAAHKILRLLYHLPREFKKFTTTALWDDRQIGLCRLQDFDRVAVVTDVIWIRTLASKLDRSESAEFGVFANSEFDRACSWICA